MSISVNAEFDIFACTPIQTTIVHTTYVTYKPIASEEQADLDFLIPAHSDTYIDLNKKLYIRSKLTKANGKIGQYRFHCGDEKFFVLAPLSM